MSRSNGARTHPRAHHQRGGIWVIDLPGGLADEVAPDPASGEAPEPPADVAEAGALAAAEVAEAMGGRPVEDVAGRLRAGSRCFVARVDGSVACYGWLTSGGEWIGEMDRRLALGSDEAYIWDCATLAPHRRRGLYGALLRAMLQTLAGEGCRRAWIGSNLSNEPSVRAFARVGFRPVAHLSYWRVGSASGFVITAGPGANPADVATARLALRSSRERTLGGVGVGWRLVREAPKPTPADS